MQPKQPPEKAGTEEDSSRQQPFERALQLSNRVREQLEARDRQSLEQAWTACVMSRHRDFQRIVSIGKDKDHPLNPFDPVEITIKVTDPQARGGAAPEMIDDALVLAIQQARDRNRGWGVRVKVERPFQGPGGGEDTCEINIST